MTAQENPNERIDFLEHQYEAAFGGWFNNDTVIVRR